MNPLLFLTTFKERGEDAQRGHPGGYRFLNRFGGVAYHTYRTYRTYRSADGFSADGSDSRPSLGE